MVSRRGRAPQRFRGRELSLHAGFLLLAIALSYQMTGTAKHGLRAASGRAIAVLPFRNLSDSKEDEYFSDGITDDIIAQLSKITDLKVISRTSVLPYKDLKKNVREIGKELGVATVLEGSVRRSGNQVRIVAQLIDAGLLRSGAQNTQGRGRLGYDLPAACLALLRALQRREPG